MDYRSLGPTGMMVSPLCLGAMMFGPWGEPDHAAGTAIIHRALDAGINFIDTADVYSGGESETIVGEALAGALGDEHADAAALVEHAPVDQQVDRLAGGGGVDPVERGELVRRGDLVALSVGAREHVARDPVGELLEDGRPVVEHVASFVPVAALVSWFSNEPRRRCSRCQGTIASSSRRFPLLRRRTDERCSLHRCREHLSSVHGPSGPGQVSRRR